MFVRSQCSNTFLVLSRLYEAGVALANFVVDGATSELGEGYVCRGCASIATEIAMIHEIVVHLFVFRKYRLLYPL